MSDADFDRVYRLIPGVHRDRDLLVGQPLRAFMAVIEDGYRLLADGLTAGYDDWFIETCRPWLVPYIGDLLGLPRALYEPHLLDSHRGLVAKTTNRRRRKGTIGALGDAFSDATCAPTRAVEGLERAAFAQNVGAITLARGRTIDVRDAEALARLGGPFDAAARTSTIRTPSRRTGPERDWNLDVRPRAATIFAWRLRSYPVRAGAALPVEGVAGAFTIDPCGRDVRLFNAPPDDTGALPSADPCRYPAPLDPRLLALEVAARRAGRPPLTHFFSAPAALRLFREVEAAEEAVYAEVPPTDLAIGDLSDWSAPRPIVVGTTPSPPESAPVWLDPVLGRLLFTGSSPPRALLADYAYGLAQDVGAGTYPRPGSPAAFDWEATVARPSPARSPATHETLVGALAAWRAAVDAPGGPRTARITIIDDGTYPLGDEPARLAPRGTDLTIVAADSTRPCVPGSFAIDGGGLGGRVRLAGLLLAGGVEVTPDVVLEVDACTLLPGLGPVVERGRQRLACSVLSRGAGTGSVQLTRSLLGRVAVDGPLSLSRTVVDGGGGSAVMGADGRAGPALATLGRCTLLGDVQVQELADAVDSIFVEPLRVLRTSSGQVRRSWLAAGSITPLAVEVYRPDGTGAGPRFVSLRPDDASYCQLALTAAPSVLAGASDGGQLGAMCGSLCDRPRIEDWVLGEYLRAGYAANIVYVT